MAESWNGVERQPASSGSGTGTGGTGLDKNAVLALIRGNANRLTVGPSFPASPLSGALHLFSVDDDSITAKTTNGRDLTGVKQGWLFRYNGTNWLFTYGFDTLIELLIAAASLYAGEYAGRTAYAANKIVTHNDDIFWTVAAVADTNTTAPASNSAFVQLNGGGGSASSGITAEQFLAAMPDDLKIERVSFSPAFLDPTNIEETYTAHVRVLNGTFADVAFLRMRMAGATGDLAAFDSISLNPVSVTLTDAQRKSLSVGLTALNTFTSDVTIDFIESDRTTIVDSYTIPFPKHSPRDSDKVLKWGINEGIIKLNDIQDSYNGYVQLVERAFLSAAGTNIVMLLNGHISSPVAYDYQDDTSLDVPIAFDATAKEALRTSLADVESTSLELRIRNSLNQSIYRDAISVPVVNITGDGSSSEMQEEKNPFNRIAIPIGIRNMRFVVFGQGGRPDAGDPPQRVGATSDYLIPYRGAAGNMFVIPSGATADFEVNLQDLIAIRSELIGTDLDGTVFLIVNKSNRTGTFTTNPSIAEVFPTGSELSPQSTTLITLNSLSANGPSQTFEMIIQPLGGEEPEDDKETLYGTGVPASTLGVMGDSYIRIQPAGSSPSGVVYKKTTSTTWAQQVDLATQAELDALATQVENLETHTGITTLNPTVQYNTPNRGSIMPAHLPEDALFVLEEESHASDATYLFEVGERRVSGRDYFGIITGDLQGDLTNTIGSSASGMFALRRIAALVQINDGKIKLVAPNDLFNAASLTAGDTELRIAINGFSHQTFVLQASTFESDGAATRVIGGTTYAIYETTVDAPFGFFELSTQAGGVHIQVVQEVSGVKQFLSGETTAWATGNVHGAGIYTGDENGVPYEVEIKRKPNVLLPFDVARTYADIVLPTNYRLYNELFLIVEQSGQGVNLREHHIPVSALGANLDYGYANNNKINFVHSTRVVSRKEAGAVSRFVHAVLR